MKFEIVCDSAADLTQKYADKAHITVVPFYVSFDGENYMKEGRDISVSDFYKKMAESTSCFPKTSMPTILDYIEAFKPFAKNGIPVICICLTEKFSGSLQSALNAKTVIEERIPGSKIYVIDSQLVTALQGLLVNEAVRLRDMDIEPERAVHLLESIRSSGQIFFTTKDLKYLQHGGRLGKAACIAGSVLNLKPVLHFRAGELGHTEICRGRKNSMQKVVEKFFRYLKNSGIDLKGYWFGTGIGLEVDEYEAFQNLIEKRMNEENVHPDKWIKVQIGATIGVHTGPYPMGLGILKKCDI